MDLLTHPCDVTMLRIRCTHRKNHTELQLPLSQPLNFLFLSAYKVPSPSPFCHTFSPFYLPPPSMPPPLLPVSILSSSSHLPGHTAQPVTITPASTQHQGPRHRSLVLIHSLSARDPFVSCAVAASCT